MIKIFRDLTAFQHRVDSSQVEESLTSTERHFMDKLRHYLPNDLKH